MTIWSFKQRHFLKRLALGCLLSALAGNYAIAAGGAPDPPSTPQYQADAVQIAAITKDFLALVVFGGGTPDPSELSKLETLVSQLIEVDLHVGLTDVTGNPSNSGDEDLDRAQREVRKNAVILRKQVNDALLAAGGGAPDPPNTPESAIVDNLRFMGLLTRMIIGRVDYMRREQVAMPVPDS